MGLRTSGSLRGSLLIILASLFVAGPLWSQQPTGIPARSPIVLLGNRVDVVVALTGSPSSVLRQEPEPFRFHISAPLLDSEGREVWAAFVGPDDRRADSTRPRPAAFRIRLDKPTSEHSSMPVKGTLLRGDAGGATFFNIEFGPKFMRASGSGGMVGMSIEPADSLPFTATVRTTADSTAPWTAMVKLRKGGQFLLALNQTDQWGEFRPIPKYSLQVLFAVEGLFAPR